MAHAPDAGEDRGATHERDAARRRWRAARSFAELCALASAFLEGCCPAFPGWGAPEPDDETDAILSRLVGLNRAGFLTLASQPGFEGWRDGRAVRQRAFVTGFATAELARRLQGGRGIEVRTWGAHEEAGPHTPSTEEPMTLVDGTARVLSGHAARAEELHLFEDEIGPDAFSALGAATYVAAWDPTFGRASHLWDELERRLQA